MANDNIRNFKIEETFTEVIKPIEVFSEILTDLAFSSYSVEGNENIVEQLRTIFNLVCKNTKEKLDKLRELNSFNATESTDTVKQGAESADIGRSHVTEQTSFNQSPARYVSGMGNHRKVSIRTLRALRRAFYRRSIAYICQIMLTN